LSHAACNEQYLGEFWHELRFASSSLFHEDDCCEKKLALEEALLVLAVGILSVKIESPGAGYMVERWDPSASQFEADKK